MSLNRHIRVDSILLYSPDPRRTYSGAVTRTTATQGHDGNTRGTIGQPLSGTWYPTLAGAGFLPMVGLDMIGDVVADNICRPVEREWGWDGVLGGFFGEGRS